MDRTFSKRMMGLLGALVLAVSAQAGLASAPAGATAPSCQHFTIPVALSDSAPKSERISAELCVPSGGAQQIEILTPGGGYNSAYWDWPQFSHKYSYVDRAVAAGRATLNYDRIGTGSSSRPLSTTVGVQNEAYVLKQIVDWTRSNQGFNDVTLVGHSFGSAISIQEAGTYRNVNRLVSTGVSHVPNVGVGFAAALIALTHPATLDPEFANAGYDLGYVTTTPGSRSSLFYSSSADPAVLAYDEAHREVLPLTGLTSLSTTLALPPLLNASNRIDVPVLDVLGQEDQLFCNAPNVLNCASGDSVRNSESLYYTSTPSLTGAVIPGTGHDIALHPSADQSFAVINNWVNTHS